MALWIMSLHLPKEDHARQYRLVLTVALNHCIYTKRASCYFTLTIKPPDIVAIRKLYTDHVHATPKLNCMGRTQYSNLPNFILPKVV